MWTSWESIWRARPKQGCGAGWLTLCPTCHPQEKPTKFCALCLGWYFPHEPGNTIKHRSRHFVLFEKIEKIEYIFFFFVFFDFDSNMLGRYRFIRKDWIVWIHSNTQHSQTNAWAYPSFQQSTHHTPLPQLVPWYHDSITQLSHSVT